MNDVVTGISEYCDGLDNAFSGSCPVSCIYCSPSQYAECNKRGEFKLRTNQNIQWNNNHKPNKPADQTVVGVCSTHDLFADCTKYDKRNDYIYVKSTDRMHRALKRGFKVCVTSKLPYIVAERLAEDFKVYKDRLMIVVTLTTLDDTVRAIYEPWAPAISERIRAIKFLRGKGFYVSISESPILSLDYMQVFELACTLKTNPGIIIIGTMGGRFADKLPYRDSLVKAKMLKELATLSKYKFVYFKHTLMEAIQGPYRNHTFNIFEKRLDDIVVPTMIRDTNCERYFSGKWSEQDGIVKMSFPSFNS